MSATLTVTFTNTPGVPGVLVVRRGSDGAFWDFDSATFEAVPVTGYVVPTEDLANPGVYSWSLSQAWDGLYQFLWYSTSAKTTTPAVWSASLVAGVAQDQLTDIQTAAEAAQTAAEAIVIPSNLAVESLPGAIEAAALAGGVDEAGVRSAVGMASANLDTQLTEIKGLAAAGGASTVIVSTEQE